MQSLVTLGIAQLVNLFLADNVPLKKFYSYLYSTYNPDVTGYTLLFMIPPRFSAKEYDNNSKLNTENTLFAQVLKFLDQAPTTIDTLVDFSKVYPFFATDFTPPQTQVQNAQVQSRAGALAYASDVIDTESVTVQFIESNPLVVYKFHLLWVEYIREILRGNIKPADEYITEGNSEFGAQDYLASFYVVKYIMDMKQISYIGKCTGVYPLTLPSKDLIGTRLTNEITMLPFEYACVAYREYVEGLKTNEWLKEELEQYLADNFSLSFGDILDFL